MTNLKVVNGRQGSASCGSKAGTITVTILAGPLNYVGANPKVTCPTPSK
jgi:hypothetical protein